MNVDSELSIKNISLETAELILGNLEDKSKCAILKKFYCSGVDCENLYIITNRQLGEPSAESIIYQACLNDNCDYIAKWAHPSTISQNEALVYEAQLQHKASLIGIAPRVRQVWVCKKGSIMIMDALYMTLHRALKKVNQNQLQHYIEEYKKYLDFDETKVSSLEDLWNILDRIEDELGIKLDRNIEVVIPDSDEQKQYKIDLIDQAFSLIDRLHNDLEKIHGDTHVNNFMIDKTGRLYLIDLGHAVYIQTTNFRRDYGQFIYALNGYLVGHNYKNLQYIIDYAKAKYKKYDIKKIKADLEERDRLINEEDISDEDNN